MRDQPGMESAKILVSKDRGTRMVSAHVVPLKGAVIEWLMTQQCARDLERLGHCGHITLKPDQEPATVDVLRETANLRGSRGTLLEHSPVADSRGIRSVEEMTRVLVLDLSSRVESSISVHSPVYPWIVEHVTDILNKYHVTNGGKSTFGKSTFGRLKNPLGGGASTIWCTSDVPSCWESSGRGHDGKVALGHVVGKTVPHRRTSGGTEGEIDL